MNYWIRGHGIDWNEAELVHDCLPLTRRINTRRNRRIRWYNYLSLDPMLEMHGVSKKLRDPSHPANVSTARHFLQFEAMNPGFSRRTLLKHYNAQDPYSKLRDLSRLVHQNTRIQLVRKEVA